MKVSDFIVSFLEELKVKNIFTLSGGGTIHILDSLRESKINCVCCHHEQAVAIASEAYSRVSKHIGVSLVTTGPGGTNAITGVACSWMDSVPHLIISGQAYTNQTIQDSKTRQIGVQEINIIDIIKPITKYSIMITDPNKIKYELQKAYHIATTGRPGPVWVDIPADVQMADVDPALLEEFSPDEIKLKYDDVEKKVSEVVKLLKSSKRPLFHVGQGLKISGAVEEFIKFCEKNNLPFVTARNANDIIESNHPLFIGRPGTWGTRSANFAIQTCDLIICIGCRLALSAIGYNSKDFARNAEKVVVDIDKNELYKFTIDVDLGINCDARDFVSELSKQLRTSLNTEKWLKRCQDWKKKYPVTLPEYKDCKNNVNAYYFIDVLSDLLDSEDVITTDMGLSFQCMHQAFKVKKGQRFFTNSGLAPMGYGLPASVGACFANNKKRTILVTGDGGLQLNLQELQTVVHNKLPVKIFVFNNKGYHTIKQSFDYGFKRKRIATGPDDGLSCPDSVKIGEAYGMKTCRIRDHRDIKKKIKEVIDHKGPVICDVIIDENQIQMPRVLNKKDQDGNQVPTPFEDMFPYLDRDEFKENIKIED